MSWSYFILTFVSFFLTSQTTQEDELPHCNQINVVTFRGSHKVNGSRSRNWNSQFSMPLTGIACFHTRVGQMRILVISMKILDEEEGD